MLLMEQIYEELHESSLVETAEQFSTDWCWRSRSWYAVQKNKQRDMSISVAINCLNKVKIKIAFAHMSRKKLGSIADSDIRMLSGIRESLESYLLNEHRISGVADDERLNGKMLGFL